MATRERPGIYVAKKSFFTQVDGKTCRIRKGITRVEAGHPLLKGREHLFAPDTTVIHFPVETTASEPGEPRGIAPAKRTAPKAPASKRTSRGGKK